MGSSQYGNEWINYSQSYYQFKIWQDGVYKLDYATLQSAGVPVSTIQPENYQIFGFEQEQSIFIEDGNDGSFDSGDYILFIGRKNTTWLDSLLYENPDDVANKYYPHYNDTITYFLTWNNSTSNNRMNEETDVSFSSYTASSFLYKTNAKFYSTYYAEGYKLEGLSFSGYEEGEGWASSPVNALSTTNYIDSYVATTYAYTLSGAPSVSGEAVSMSVSNATSSTNVNHHLQLQYGSSNTTVHDITFSGYKKNKLSFTFAASQLGSSSTLIRHEFINDLGLTSDQQCVAYVELTYPHTPNLEGSTYLELLNKNHSTQLKNYYNLTNFGGTSPIAFCYDQLDQVTKLEGFFNSGTSAFQLLVPNSSNGNNQRLIVVDENSVQSITNLQAVNGTGTFTDYTSINFSDTYIIVTDQSLSSSAGEYQSYRESVEGGGNTVILAYEDELNLQFGGGVPKHIMGLRRFIHYAYNQSVSTTIPRALLILGKGVREADESISTGYGMRKGTAAYATCLVPTFGYPTSDMAISSNLENNDWAPLIPIGRVAANSNEEVILYLNKVKEFELAQDQSATYSIDSKYWQKDILHFGGGSTASEQSLFKTYLHSFEYTLEDTLFGGHVTSFYKTVSDPIDPVTLYEVTDYINNGVSIMTFFGHASADGFDQNVDDPDNWDNQGKYPLIVGNACLTGNIYEPNNLSASEDFIFIEDKGAIAFLANTKQAFSNGLYSYSSRFFDNLSWKYYGATIGELMLHTVEQIQSGSQTFPNLTTITQMTLHGDPYLRINPHDKPELEVNSNSIFIEPDEVDLTVDSIDVNVIVYNMGQSATDTFGIELTRSFPNNGGDSTYSKILAGINYIDTVTFTIPFYANQGIGINNFTVEVDQPSMIEEVYDEYNNNIITKQVIFDIDGLYPVWPYNYAVVPNDTVTVKASTVNPFADELTYRIEIDTTDLYNSPEHRYALVTSTGGVIEVNYNEWLSSNTGTSNELILSDSMVYFWRTSVEDPTNYYWNEHSFQYIHGKQGWGQDHFFQFKNNDFSFLNYNRTDRTRYFYPASKTISCDVYGNATSWLETAYTLWRINGDIAEYNFCSIEPAILVGVVDPFTLEAWGTRYDDGTTVYNPNNNFGNSNDNGGCRARVEKHFAYYQNNATQMASLEDLLTNQIPDDYYVLIYSARYLNYSEWDIHSPQLYTMFQSLGSDSIAAGKTEVPYICFYKKGDPSSFTEVYGNYVTEHITFEDTLWGYDYNGYETSTLIGPAQEWETVYWSQYSMDNPVTDTSRLRIYGVGYNNNQTLLIDTLLSANDSIINFDALFPATQYPYLRLEAGLTDTINFTPAQLDRWHVLYTPVPEAALTSTEGYYINPTDTIYAGQDFSFAFDIKNISNLPMDSLLISYWIEDDDHNIIPISYPRQDSLRVGETIRDTLQIGSLNLDNLNSLWVEVNPYTDNFNLYTDQAEQYHFNNIGQLPFYVNADDENPILDVTFDGYHILNGDIISPSSEIVISLKDENDYLVMDSEDDTSYFGVYLTSPDGTQNRLNFRNSAGEPLMEWIPADVSTKKFKIIYSGEFDVDGTYRLLVQGSDKSGNLSGDYEYDIEFEIDSHPSVTYLMNYPNPFSTQTQFVFTLTGTQVPDEFTIQILTISGKVVREITLDELGTIRIGRNITEYRWDGTDEYGDQLANGVYLYRVITKINGETIDLRESGADQYFTKEFGKMYLMK